MLINKIKNYKRAMQSLGQNKTPVKRKNQNRLGE